MDVFWSGFEKRAEEKKKKSTLGESLKHFAKSTAGGAAAGTLGGAAAGAGMGYFSGLPHKHPPSKRPWMRGRGMVRGQAATLGAGVLGLLGGVGGTALGAARGAFGSEARKIRKGENK